VLPHRRFEKGRRSDGPFLDVAAHDCRCERDVPESVQGRCPRHTILADAGNANAPEPMTQPAWRALGRRATSVKVVSDAERVILA
jgi:hypothetical protein